MRKLILILLTTSIFLDINPQNVTIYSEGTYYPYSYQENGEMKGLYITILLEAFSRMDKYKIEIIPIPWKRGLELLESGDGFALIPPYYHPKTRPYMDYSVPILEEKVIVIGRREVMEGFKRRIWPEDFYGLTIIQNEGYNVGGSDYDLATKNKLIHEVRAKTIEACLLMLGSGRADAYICDRLAVVSVLNKMEKKGQYVEGKIHSYLVEGPIINIEWGYLGFTNRGNKKFPFKREFILEFNGIISEMKKNGDIQKVINDFLVQSMK